MQTQHNTARRGFLKAFLGTTALALPTTAGTENDFDRHQKMVDVINDLEQVHDWDSCGALAARHYAAMRMREALGMEAPTSKYVMWYGEYQEKRFNRFFGGTG